MKRNILPFITAAIVLFCAAGLYAQESDVVFIDGWVDIKDSSGEIFELFIGDRVYNGDTVITGDDGVAELEPQNGSRIIVKPGTVFSIKEMDVNGKKQSVVSTTLGQVSFKFNRMTNEPLISTPSTVMGVRGTEFTVYAGADGSSLVTVETGAVEVSGQGESVILEKNEGVEVAAGMPPGEKFPVMEGKLEFDAWNSEKINKMMGEPSAAIQSLSIQLDDLVKQIEYWAALYETNKAELTELRKQQKALLEEGKEEEGNKMKAEVVKPFEYTTSRLILNYRYYALSALSLRQHVFSGFYTRMKTAYINEPENPVYTGFLNDYSELLKQYEDKVQPYLVQADY